MSTANIEQTSPEIITLTHTAPSVYRQRVYTVRLNYNHGGRQVQAPPLAFLGMMARLLRHPYPLAGIKVGSQTNPLLNQSRRAGLLDRKAEIEVCYFSECLRIMVAK